jgi:hypothetical protein
MGRGVLLHELLALEEEEGDDVDGQVGPDDRLQPPLDHESCGAVAGESLVGGVGDEAEVVLVDGAQDEVLVHGQGQAEGEGDRFHRVNVIQVEVLNTSNQWWIRALPCYSWK